MVGRALKKAIAGGARAGAELSLNQIKQNQLEKRERMLNRFRKEMAQEDRQFRGEQSEKDRDLSRQGMQADQEYREESLGLQRDQFGLTQEQFAHQQQMSNQQSDNQEQLLERQLQQLDTDIQMGNLGLVEAQQAQALRETILDPQADPADIQAASQRLNMILGNAQQRPGYQLHTVQTDDFGAEEAYSFDPMSGTVQKLNLNDPFNGDPEDVVLQQLQQANPEMSQEALLNYIRSRRQVGAEP